MALWSGSFTEDVYSSRLDYSIDENDRFYGTYSPPDMKTWTSREDGEFQDETIDELQSSIALSRIDENHGPGSKAILDGTVDVSKDGVICVTGSWTHVAENTPFNHLSDGGRFEMVSKKGMSRSSMGPMRGSWWIPCDDQENNIVQKYPWVWDDGRNDNVQGCTYRLVQSVAYDRFGMLCGWLFFVQTTIQLVSFADEWSSNADINLAFNVDYSILYILFLLAYTRLRRAGPSWSYIGGVTLYFLGYIFFALLYTTEGDDAAAFYKGGSWLFLAGSILLMYATAPRSTIQEYNPFAKSTALFYGSTCFLLGSLCFTMDSETSGFGARVNGLAGYGLFTLGRIFFLRGSQTKRCGVFFKSNNG